MGWTFYDAQGRQKTSVWYSLRASVNFVVDGGGSVIGTGVKGDIEVPFAGTIAGWTVVADQSGSIVFDLWKDTYANFPPVDADSICASDNPKLTSQSKNQGTALTGWTKSVAQGDIIRVNVDSASTVTRVTLSLWIDRA